jgi:hypothetical protein
MKALSLWVSPAAAALAAVVLIGAAAPARATDARDALPDGIDVSAWPEDQKARYPLFQMKCSKCHPLARAVNARFTPDQWKKYAKRMIRRPNSGINEEQAVELYRFLAYFGTHGG